MDTLEVIILSLIQGLTEFLPISSSAHLILPAHIFGWKDQGLAFDVAVHIGTLAAVILYFRKDITIIFIDWLQGFRGKITSEGLVGWWIIIATIPAVIVGFFAKDWIETYFRSVLVISLSTIGFGLLLGWADKHPSQSRVIEHMRWQDALIIGLMQALAFIPGTSRSGITITAGLMLGFDKQCAARFSFLLSIPIILAAGTYQMMQLVTSPTSISFYELSIGASLSFVSAYFCIHYFLQLIQHVGLLPFIIYRIILGLILLVFFV